MQIPRKPLNATIHGETTKAYLVIDGSEFKMATNKNRCSHNSIQDRRMEFKIIYSHQTRVAGNTMVGRLFSSGLMVIIVDTIAGNDSHLFQNTASLNQIQIPTQTSELIKKILPNPGL